MSVPRPAMFVAIVTVALRPACATISRFLSVILRVQHDVPDAALFEQLREPFGLLDRDRADERRAPFLLLLQDVGDDGFVFLALGAVDGVGLLDALQFAVGRESPSRRACRSS
mgnify:CR=1 FL=1